VSISGIGEAAEMLRRVTVVLDAAGGPRNSIAA
jgi:hypothetical protein